MKFLRKCKDGGPDSTVTAYVLFEIKWLASVMLLRFDGDSREAYHDHAFNAVSWLLPRGKLIERALTFMTQTTFDISNVYKPSWRPIITKRSTFHRVDSVGRSWALTFRGPWSKTWREYNPRAERYTTLTHGREPV